MDKEIVTKWLEDYKQAWVTKNPDAIVKIFTSDAQYFETPFVVFTGSDQIRQYWIDHPGNQTDIQFRYDILSTYDSVALVRWYACFNRVKGGKEIDGIFLLEFDQQNKCKILREWWHSQPYIAKPLSE